MKSYFWRLVGTAFYSAAFSLYVLAVIIGLPAKLVAWVGEVAEREAFICFKRQDFSGPNPRGWRWSGLWH